MCYIRQSESTSIFGTNDVICRAVWRHLSFLPFQFAIFNDVGVDSPDYEWCEALSELRDHVVVWNVLTRGLKQWKTIEPVVAAAYERWSFLPEVLVIELWLGNFGVLDSWLLMGGGCTWWINHNAVFIFIFGSLSLIFAISFLLGNIILLILLNLFFY